MGRDSNLRVAKVETDGILATQPPSLETTFRYHYINVYTAHRDAGRRMLSYGTHHMIHLLLSL